MSSEPWLLLSSALYFPIPLLHLQTRAGRRVIFKDEGPSGDDLLPTHPLKKHFPSCFHRRARESPGSLVGVQWVWGGTEVLYFSQVPRLRSVLPVRRLGLTSRVPEQCLQPRLTTRLTWGVVCSAFARKHLEKYAKPVRVGKGIYSEAQTQIRV